MQDAIVRQRGACCDTNAPPMISGHGVYFGTLIPLLDLSLNLL